MKSVQLTPPTGPVHATVPLASSKSESNRALIIDALTGFRCTLQNLAAARDTQTMIRLLKSDDRNAGPRNAGSRNAGGAVARPSVADVLDAGTTMRFLTAYFAVTGQAKIMTGTPRMCERPIGILVNALRTLGADIMYLKNDGYPPLQLNGFSASATNQLSMRGDVSSQYVSALLMVAPNLPDGLEISLTGDVGSRPYIEMTIGQMRHFGADVTTDWDAKTITVAPKPYVPTTYAIESDWSGASYWYSVLALAEDPRAELELLGLKPNSLQGDSAIAEIMRALGVESQFTNRGVTLTKRPAAPFLRCDFTDCPDLAQTVAVCAAMTGTALTLTGIESLKIKETDRVLALQTELKKIGSELVEVEKNYRYEVCQLPATNVPQETPVIDTYDDHRMAMAFAPVAMQREISIDEPDVVAKSYPSFWDDMTRVATVEFVDG